MTEEILPGPFGVSHGKKILKGLFGVSRAKQILPGVLGVSRAKKKPGLLAGCSAREKQILACLPGAAGLELGQKLRIF